MRLIAMSDGMYVHTSTHKRTLPDLRALATSTQPRRATVYMYVCLYTYLDFVNIGKQ